MGYCTYYNFKVFKCNDESKKEEIINYLCEKITKVTDYYTYKDEAEIVYPPFKEEDLK